jgi:hypothetical protein
MVKTFAEADAICGAAYGERRGEQELRDRPDPAIQPRTSLAGIGANRLASASAGGASRCSRAVITRVLF